jgi:hypothetical protein
MDHNENYFDISDNDLDNLLFGIQLNVDKKDTSKCIYCKSTNLLIDNIKYMLDNYQFIVKNRTFFFENSDYLIKYEFNNNDNKLVFNIYKYDLFLFRFNLTSKICKQNIHEEIDIINTMFVNVL